MEALSSLRHPVFLDKIQNFQNSRNTLTRVFLRRKDRGKVGPFTLTVHAKQKPSEFQDFQGYAKPSRLLPASEVKVYTDATAEEITQSLKEDKSKSVFWISLTTSNKYGSSLSSLNSGVLLCLIDEDDNSVLRRIPASFRLDCHAEKGDIGVNETLHFQRSSVDVFTFEGPKLGRIKACWIGVESGQWRLGNVYLKVMNYKCLPSPEGTDERCELIGFRYEFQVEGILLGEGNDSSMVELKPYYVTDLSGVDPLTFLGEDFFQQTLTPNIEKSNEESMKDYADLKFSLLFYDAVLIFIGTAIASFSTEDTAFAFLIGGVFGFLYLLVLQRSVDGLPTSKTSGGAIQMFRDLKGPISSVALPIGFALFVVKFSSGELQMTLTPKDLVVGMMGFLASKAAVVLAAFKPMPFGLKLTK